LTLTVTTNGAVKPKNALQEVLELSKSSFDKISGLIGDEKKEKLMTETK